MMDTIRDLLLLSYVKRWVIAPLYREQSVAEHSFRVMAIVRGLKMALIAGEHVAFDLDKALLKAMDHDLEEVHTGDTPGTAKDVSKPWSDPYTLMTWGVAVKVADALETYDWWEKHGDKSWGYPYAPKKGDGNRDIRKVKHYCEGWPELLEAAKTVMVESMGYTTLEMEQIFNGKLAD